MNIKSYSFYPIDAKMYLLVENHRAVILDPCVSEEAKEYLQSENVEEIIVLLTHEHYNYPNLQQFTARYRQTFK